MSDAFRMSRLQAFEQFDNDPCGYPMGAVYRANDQVTGKTRALKLIAPHLMGSESAVQRLIEEGTTAQDIRHDNVVSVYDVGRADGQIYIAMENLQ